MKKQGTNEEMKTACRFASGGPASAFCLLPSAFANLPAPTGAGFAKAGASADKSAFSFAFTLLEIMIATALFGLVVAGTISVYIMCNKIWHATSISMQAVRESSLALSRLVYGLEPNSGLRAASMVTLSNSPDGSWSMTVSNLFGGVKNIDYNSIQKKIYWSDTNSIICSDVSTSSVTTNAGGTVWIQLTVAKSAGMFAASNTVSTSIKMRNTP